MGAAVPIVPNSCGSRSGRVAATRGRQPSGPSVPTVRLRDGEERVMAEEYFVGTKTSDRYPIWTRANVGEVFPDPVALATFDFAFQNDDGLQMSELGFRDAYVRIGAFEESEFDPDNPVFLGVFGGYTYLNASLMRIFGERAPGLSAQDLDDAFFGVQPVILEPQTGKEITKIEAEGVLCIKDSWPGQMRTVWGDHERFISAYFEDYKGYYFTGDGCRRDLDGYYWITGRVDDVINVSGHRMGTAEVESALVAHPSVAEAAVVGYPHEIKGQGIYCYVTLMTGEKPTDELRLELRSWLRKEIGPIASPDLLQWAPGLPKTRSGKIMRRILRKVAEDDFGSLGDTSTLADPSVVEDLIKNRMNQI